MMVYATFLETVKSAIQSRLGDAFTITLCPVPKNNGMIFDGLSIHHQSKPLAPVIHMNAYYSAFQSGMALEEILTDMMELISGSRLPDGLQLDSLTDLDGLVDRVVFHLVNAPANRSLLDEIPHIIFPELELALTFYLFLEDSKKGRLSALIRNCHKEAWHLSDDDLYEAALINTPSLLPPVIQTIYQVMDEMEKKTGSRVPVNDGSQQEPKVKLHVLSNSTSIDGACCLFYPGILKNFAEEKGGDIIILPSSIHEVLLAPYHPDMSYEDMAGTIVRINRNDVPMEERLSNILYRYSCREDRITAVFNPFIPVTDMNDI